MKFCDALKVTRIQPQQHSNDHFAQLYFTQLFSATYKKLLSYEHDVSLSDCLSLTLVDCNHIVQEKVKIDTWQDSSVTWLPAS